MDEQLGQADSAPGGIDAIARLLVDNPGVTTPDPQEEETEQHTSDEAGDGQTEEANDAPAQDDGEKKPESEDAAQQASAKFKVTVKGDSGEDEELEVDEGELKSGYMRTRDYTRKTMELADREREAFQVVTGKINEFQQHYLQQAQTLRQAIQHSAGLRSAEEMAALAQSDPSAWVQENQRQQSLNAFLARMDQSMQQEIAQAKQLQQEQQQARQRRMGEVLMKEGFDVPQMQGLLQGVSKSYGFTPEQLRNIDDPALVRMMRDAVAYRDLQAKKPDVTKKVQEAPKLPPTRRPTPKSEQVDRQLTQRFQSGRAKLNDLAAFLKHNHR